MVKLTSPAPYTATLAECLAKVSLIEGISFTHCPREANNVAHQLAKNSYDRKLDLIWDGGPPSFLLPFGLHGVILLI